MKAWVYGYFGHGNIGDDAIMLSVLDGLAKRNQKALILTDNVAASRAITNAACLVTPPLNAKRFGAKYKVGYWMRNGLKVATKLVGRNACIYACGGSINDHVIGRVEDMHRRIEGLKALGFRVGILGAGIDSLSSPVDRTSARVIIEELLDYCSVRDQGSVDLLNDIGVSESKFCLSADPVFAIPPVVRGSQNKKRLCDIEVGLNLRSLFQSNAERGDSKMHRHADYLTQCKALVERLTESVGCVKLIPFAPEDELFLRKFSDIPKVEIIPYTAHPTMALRNVGALDLLVGMRLHAIIFSVIAGVPCVPIPYAPKVASLAEALGVDFHDLIVSDGTFFPENALNVDAIENAMKATWSDRKMRSTHALKIATTYRRKAQQDIEDCWKTLTAVESASQP